MRFRGISGSHVGYAKILDWHVQHFNAKLFVRKMLTAGVAYDINALQASELTRKENVRLLVSNQLDPQVKNRQQTKGNYRKHGYENSSSSTYSSAAHVCAERLPGPHGLGNRWCLCQRHPVQRHP